MAMGQHWIYPNIGRHLEWEEYDDDRLWGCYVGFGASGKRYYIKNIGRTRVDILDPETLEVLCSAKVLKETSKQLEGM